MTYLSEPKLTIITSPASSMKETFVECIKGISNVLHCAPMASSRRIKKVPTVAITSSLNITPCTDLRSIRTPRVIVR